jgi:carbon storage regulator
MLVLSRKPRQSVTINGDIVITVLEVRGKRVRLGVQAPSDVAVRRSEIVQLQGRSGEPAGRPSFPRDVA